MIGIFLRPGVATCKKPEFLAHLRGLRNGLPDD